MVPPGVLSRLALALFRATFFAGRLELGQQYQSIEYRVQGITCKAASGLSGLLSLRCTLEVCNLRLVKGLTKRAYLVTSPRETGNHQKNRFLLGAAFKHKVTSNRLLGSGLAGPGGACVN